MRGESFSWIILTTGWLIGCNFNEEVCDNLCIRARTLSFRMFYIVRLSEGELWKFEGDILLFHVRETYKFRLSAAISRPNVNRVDLIFQQASHILRVCGRIVLRNSICFIEIYSKLYLIRDYFDKMIIMRNFCTGQLIKKDLDVTQMLL